MYYEYVGAGAWPNSKLFKFFFVTYIDCSDDLSLLPILINPIDSWIRETRNLPVDSIRVFPYNNVECNNRSTEQCFNKYFFSDTISIRDDLLPYSILTQSCCRVSTIDNLIDPENTAIITNTILDELIFNENNSSPKFINTSLLSFCVGDLIDFEYRVTEPDGDELFFSLCSPLGNSPGFPFTLYPPYPMVQFIEPTYTSNFPLGQGSLGIDSESGQLSGTPQTVGNYVIGICVEEYRNGTFLGFTRQDLVITVVPCTPSIEADLEEESITNLNHSLYNLCPESTLTFQNLSSPSESITDYKWFIDCPDQPMTSILEDPTFIFDQSGTFYGHMVVNPDSICNDTAFFVVEVSNILADFDWTVSTEDQFSPEVQFVDQSTEAVIWDWKIPSDPMAYIEPEFTYEFESYGPQHVSLVVEDLSGCKDTSSQIIEIPYPNTYFLPNAFTPNSDGLNDEFIGVGVTESISNFQLQIFNRWGKLIFSSQSPDTGWTGDGFSSSVYVYKVSFLKSDGELFLKQGEVALVR